MVIYFCMADLLDKSKFLVWEGKEYRVDETPTGFSAFVKDGSGWKEVSGKLVATLLFEGVPKSNWPSLTFCKAIESATGIKPVVRVKKAEAIAGKIERYKLAGKDATWINIRKYS